MNLDESFQLMRDLRRGAVERGPMGTHDSPWTDEQMKRESKFMMLQLTAQQELTDE